MPLPTARDAIYLRKALELLKERGVGKYFEMGASVAEALEDLYQTNSNGRASKEEKVQELRGLCAALLRRHAAIVEMRIVPSFPELARMVNYRSHGGAISADRKYGPVIEDLLKGDSIKGNPVKRKKIDRATQEELLLRLREDPTFRDYADEALRKLKESNRT